jgi:hypothetical protein
MNIIDFDYYSKDFEVLSLLNAIKITIKHRISTINFNKDIVLAEVEAELVENLKEQCENTIIPIILLGESASNKELEFINETIEINLKYSTAILAKDRLIDVITDLTSGKITNLKSTMDKYKSIINLINEEFRKSDNLSTNNLIHSSDTDYLSGIYDVYNDLRHPKYSLKTGIKAFNNMLSEQGGFIPSCYYIIYASINSFKSAILQYIANWIMLYNSDNYIDTVRKTGKIPTVLVYQFENTRKENMQRDFLMRTGISLKDVKNTDEVKKMWNTQYNRTNSIIDITTIYAEAGTVRVSDIKKQIHVLNENGYNVVACIIDYLELLRCEDEDVHLDNRLKLGNISSSLHVLAIMEEIVVITAMQMNRNAEIMIADKKLSGESNIVRHMGRQFIGESYGIDKPVDFSMFIALERSIYDNKLYLTCKKEKCRYKRTPTDYFVHEIRNGLYLEEDYLTDKTVSKPSIAPDTSNDINIYMKQGEENIIKGKRGATSVREGESKKITIKPKEEIVEDDQIEKIMANLGDPYGDNFYIDLFGTNKYTETIEVDEFTFHF